MTITTGRPRAVEKSPREEALGAESLREGPFLEEPLREEASGAESLRAEPPREEAPEVAPGVVGLGRRYADAVRELVETSRAEARAVERQYRVIHRMWRLLEEAHERRWAAQVDRALADADPAR